MGTIYTHCGTPVLVDDEDVERLSAFRWHRKQSGHVHRSIQRGKIKRGIHRDVIDAPDGVWVDHINGDPLDNRKVNLRLCDRVGNSRNSSSKKGSSSSFKGVCWHKASRKWQAGIKVNRKSIHLGLFATEQQAAAAYDASAKEHFGEFARLNAPA